MTTKQMERLAKKAEKEEKAQKAKITKVKRDDRLIPINAQNKRNIQKNPTYQLMHIYLKGAWPHNALYPIMRYSLPHYNKGGPVVINVIFRRFNKAIRKERGYMLRTLYVRRMKDSII